LLGLTIGTLTVSQLSAQSLPESLSLEEAQRLAIEHSPTLEETRAGIKQNEGVLITAKSGTLPSLDASAGYTVVDDTPARNDQSWSASLGISYRLYSGGSVRAGIRSAKASLAIAQSQYEAAINNVILQVKNAYYLGLYAREAIAAQEEAINVLREQLNLAQRRYDAGTGSQFEVLQAEVALANERPSLVRARNQYRLAVESLRSLIGLSYPTGVNPEDVSLITDWMRPEIDLSIDSAISRGLSARPELLAAQEGVTASEAGIESARSGALPQVSLSAGYGANSNTASPSLSDYNDGFNAGARVSWNIWDANATKGRVVSAQSRLRASEASLAAVQVSIENDVRNAYYSLEEAREVLLTAAEVIRQAEEALRLARDRYTAGVATQLDVLQAQLALTQARLRQAEAMRSHNSAWASLQQAMGTR